MPQNSLQGSVWRKWDLHVHTPKTKLNDQYLLSTAEGDVWKTFCDKLEQSDVSVFGITDYFSVDNYFTFLEKFKANYPESEKIFFPNIEFRLVDKNKENDNINLHVILSDELDRESIEKFLGNIALENVSTDGSALKCNRTDLEKVGFDNAIVKHNAITKALSETFGNKHPYLIFGVSNGYGGIRPNTASGRPVEYAKIIDEASDAFFGRAQDKSFFLSERYESSVPKAVVGGSDAHSFGDLDQSLGKQVIVKDKDGNDVITKDVTWIKADATLSGLKQICFEPEDRVNIQKENPFNDRAKLHFNQLNITGRVRYVVPNNSLVLNRELVTIIGGRGSGKSALLESLALLNESHTKVDGNDKPRLVEYYRKNIDGIDPSPSFTVGVQLVDKDGKAEAFQKSLNSDLDLELPFLFIGQEQLSAKATNDAELTEIVCNLLNIDEGSFQDPDLIESGRGLNTSINVIRSEIGDLLEKYEYAGDDFIKWMDQKIAQKNVQKNKLTSKETKQLLEEINAITKRGLQLNSLKEEFVRLEESFSNIDLNRIINEYNERLEELFPEQGRTIPLINLKMQLDHVQGERVKLDEEIKSLRKQFADKKALLIKSGLKEDVNVLVQASQSIERELNTLVTDRKLYDKKEKELREFISLRSGLLKKITEHADASAKSITDEFGKFINSREDSEDVEKLLFARIIKGIAVEGQVNFDQKRFCDYLLANCLDGRKVKNHEDLKKQIAGVTSTGQSKDITLGILQAWAENSLASFCKEYCTGSDSESCLVDFLFAEWNEFIKVKAVAKLDGVVSEKLSVGQRGTLLLKVYLATSNAKPIIIIDQPEDNLDNYFIMHELVPLIKDIKKTRQIIIATHNANLVVNTDAEQVIVADLSKEPPYFLGSIENPMINKSICEILEGGKVAFERRQAKYRIFA